MTTLALYRFWSVDSELLYIGRTGDLFKRMEEHRRTKPWWPEVATVTVEHFDTREEMLASELVAIKAEPTKYPSGPSRESYARGAATKKATDARTRERIIHVRPSRSAISDALDLYGKATR